MKLLLALSLGLLLASGPRSTAADNPPAPDSDKDVAVMTTSDGVMVIEFWTDIAPKTVANFKKLAKEGFYDGTCFHRIIKGFMIQGGDPNTKDPAKESLYGTGGPGYSIPAEFNSRKHTVGVLSMARSAHPDSAGSQFFICDGPAPFLDNKYTAFGKVIQGLPVLKKIADTPVTGSRGGEKSKPTRRVEVKSIKIVPASNLKPAATPPPSPGQ